MSVDQHAGARAAPQGGRRIPFGLDRFELGTLLALLAFSFAVLGGMLVRVWIRGGVVTGADSYVALDQLQYLNWIRQAGHHLAVQNLYDISDSPHSLVHPGVLLAGLLHRLGLGVVPAYHVLKPVAVVALFAGTLLYIRRFLDRPGDRRLALVVALFSVSPVAALVSRAGFPSNQTKLRFDFLAGEMWTGNYLWGYTFTAIAVALLPLGLLAYERGRAAGSRRALALAAVSGLFCAWLQPWQGVTFAIVLVGAEGVLVARAEPRGPAAARAVRDLAGPLAATALPLIYYLILSHTDSAWELAGTANETGTWPWWITVVGLAPLALPALFAYRQPAPDFGALALRAWPLAALAVFYQPAGTFPAHAFQGLTIPLTILATLALRRHLGARALSPALVAAVLLVLLVPGTIHRVDQLRGAVNKGLQPFFLTDDEHDALGYLAATPEKGGVITSIYSGQAVPAYTGRATWIGATSWTPDFKRRRLATDALFSGALTPARAERLVRRSGARFVYSDCQGHPDITRTVRAFTDPPLRFGCATVYRVRGPA